LQSVIGRQVQPVNLARTLFAGRFNLPSISVASA
jgi:hypothetical protein